MSFTFELSKLPLLLTEAELQRLSQARARWPVFSPSVILKAPQPRQARTLLSSWRSRSNGSCLLIPEQNQESKAHHHQRCLRRHAWDAQALRMWPARASEQTKTKTEMHAQRCREPARFRLSPASEKVGSKHHVLRKAGHEAWHL